MLGIKKYNTICVGVQAKGSGFRVQGHASQFPDPRTSFLVYHIWAGGHNEALLGCACAQQHHTTQQRARGVARGIWGVRTSLPSLLAAPHSLAVPEGPALRSTVLVSTQQYHSGMPFGVGLLMGWAPSDPQL